MYRFEEKQLSFTDFNQPQGLQMNPENRWIKKAEMIPWDTIEKEYAKLFPSRTGMPAKPLRMALGSLLIQKQYHYPDEELVEPIRENPYFRKFPDKKDIYTLVGELCGEYLNDAEANEERENGSLSKSMKSKLSSTTDSGRGDKSSSRIAEPLESNIIV